MSRAIHSFVRRAIIRAFACALPFAACAAPAVAPAPDYAAIIAAGGRRAVIYQQLRELIEARGDLVRQRYPRIPRRVSGYNLDSLLPESGFDVGRALVGSESTLITILQAELRLVPAPPARSLVVLGYPDIASAADAVPHILPHQPEQLEGVDDRLITVERERRMNPTSLQLLPEGNGWLMVWCDCCSTSSCEVRSRREFLLSSGPLGAKWGGACRPAVFSRFLLDAMVLLGGGGWVWPAGGPRAPRSPPRP